MILRTALAALLLAGCGGPPDPERIAAPVKAAPSGGKDVLDALEARARRVLEAIERPTDRAAWERAAPRLRRRLLDSLGLERLPKPQPRNVRLVGTLDRDAFRIEKLVYETLPGCEVPAHLYLPGQIQGKIPAVLFVPGHWYADSKGKADFQAFCVNMARMGFAVLAYDPIGQGERGISLRDHRRTELLLAGVAQQAIVDFESLCALEVLLARPEVDAGRIGITGASGGGYNSWIVAALDPRIAVSVPVVGTSEFHEQLRAVREADWYDAKEHCHFVPGLLRYANNHEFLAMVAPRPVLVISAHKDHSFPIPGIRQVVEHGRALYAALGAPGKIGYFEDESEGHGYGKRKREAAYGWFLRWLKGEGEGRPVAEPLTETPRWDSPELRCFPPGENRPAGPGIMAQVGALLGPPPKPSWAPPRSVIRRDLVEALGIPDSRDVPRIASNAVSWRGADGLSKPALLLKAPGSSRGVLLAAADAGKESLVDHPAVRAAAEAGLDAVLADVRGTGELATAKPGWTFAVSLLLGENFAGRQAEDLAEGWRALHASRGANGGPVGFLGVGPFASLAATYAAVLEPRAAFLIADGGFASYRSFAERPKSIPQSFTLARPGGEKTVKIDREIPSALFVFDVLRRFDLPDLYGAVLPRPVLVANAIDGDCEPLGEEALRSILARTRYAWKDRPEAAAGPRAAAAVEGFLRSAVRREAPAGPIGGNVSTPVPRGGMPNRVHAIEDFETEIERRWWLCGQPETRNVPAGSRRACRGTPAHDFDDLMGDPSRAYAAVVFNPVPGPPVGKNPRLGFRCWIKGGDRLRVQIYSLSKGYHRHLTLEGLPRERWQEITADMTRARRPDGSGGPLSEDERIDDIQFYAAPDADLLIDDIVLFDAARPGESEPFPQRPVFTAWFDTGRHGREWPGDFEIVDHEKPLSWKAARSVPHPKSGIPVIRLDLRGERPLGEAAKLRFRYRLDGPGGISVTLRSPAASYPTDVKDPERGRWGEATVDFTPARKGIPAGPVEEISFTADRGAELLVDDVFLYEPADVR